MRSAEAPGRAVRLFPLLLLLAACGVMDDLAPSGADRRPGTAQTAPDFLLADTSGNPVSLYETLGAARGAVLYFTMWCPICDAHMNDLQARAVPAFPDVRFLILDYVSGSWAEARSAQVAAGWDGAPFTVLADVGASVERFYSAGMGVVIVGRDRVVRMNGEYDWSKVQAALSSLP